METRVFIEYDFSQTYEDSLPTLKPFVDNNSVWNLNHDALNWVKDYRFFSALAGVRNEENGIEPLFPPRGLPPHCDSFVKEEIESQEPPYSWLLADELVAALEHANQVHDQLSVPAQILIETVAHLAKRCGSDRVRIVFAFT